MPQQKHKMVAGFISRKTLISTLSILAVLLIALGCGAWTVFGAQKQITISIDEETKHVRTFEHTVAGLLAENDIELGENDVIDAALRDTLTDGQVINIQRAKGVTIIVDGEEIKMNLVADKVANALEKAGVTLGENDIVEPALDAIVESDMVIDVDRVYTEQVIRETEIAYTIERRRDSSMSIYDEQTLQEGKSGLLTEVYEVTYREDQILEEVLISSETVDPIKQIVVTGSYDVASRSNKTNGGDTSQAAKQLAPNGMAYSKVFTCKATAYTYDGCLTASGTVERVGAIAVDPSVIPLGTKLYVEGYGYCVAEDTGGFIKGNRIDVYLNSEEECVAWGVKNVKVYILD